MSGNDLSTLHKFNGWRCDSCGGLITSIDAGWVEWLSSEGDRGEDVLSGLQLVHHGSVLPNGAGQSCRYDRLKEFRNRKTIVEGLPLERSSLMGVCLGTRFLSLQNECKFPAMNSPGICQRI
jgi:hypothetical protein